MSTRPFIYVRDKFAPEDVHHAVWESCMTKRWYFGHTSRSTSRAPFWKMDLAADEAAMRLWEFAKPICERTLGLALNVSRQYANGHTYGLGEDIHRDDDQEGTYTLLYYPMLEWRADWDGETIYQDRAGEVIQAVSPVPNRAVLFDARIPHGGRAPSRFYGGLRVTIAYKLSARPAQGARA